MTIREIASSRERAKVIWALLSFRRLGTTPGVQQMIDGLGLAVMPAAGWHRN
jgi:hypothetical protein